MASHLAEDMSNFKPAQHLLGCMAHILNLAAKAGIKALGATIPIASADDDTEDDPMAIANLLGPRDFDAGYAGPVVDRIRAIARSMSHSTQRLERFRTIVNYEMLGTMATTMIQDVPTRWNSTAAMLQRAYDLRRAVDLYIRGEPTLARHTLSQADWDLIEQVIRLLRPFETATKKLSGVAYPAITSACLVQKLLLRRIRVLVATYDRSVLAAPIAEIIKKLKQYEAKAVKQAVWFNAMILDPRFKLEHFRKLPEQERNGLPTVRAMRTTFFSMAQMYAVSPEHNEDESEEEDSSASVAKPSARKLNVISTGPAKIEACALSVGGGAMVKVSLLWYAWLKTILLFFQPVCPVSSCFHVVDVPLQTIEAR